MARVTVNRWAGVRSGVVVAAVAALCLRLTAGVDAQSGVWPPVLLTTPSDADAPAAAAFLLPGKPITVNAVAVDAQDNIYLAGTGSATDVPGLDRGFDGTPDGGDAFIAKLDRSGTPLWATYLGGTDRSVPVGGSRISQVVPDSATAIAVDAAGQVYVAGVTAATNFPLVNAFQSSHAGELDGFVAKLSADGRRLLFSSYIGAAGEQISAHGIAVGPAGETLVEVFSPRQRLIASRDLSEGRGAIVILRLNSSGAPVWSTRVDLAEPGGFAVDGSGRLYLSGPQCAGFSNCSHALLRLDPSGTTARATTIQDHNADVNQSSLALLPNGRAAFASVAYEPILLRNAFAAATPCPTEPNCGDAFLAIVDDAGTLETISYLGIGAAQPRIAAANDGSITIATHVVYPALPVLRALVDHHPDGPVYVSRDRATTWQVAGRETSPARGIADLVFSALRNSLFAVETAARLFESVDEVNGWRLDTPGEWYHVAVDPRQPSVRYGVSGDHVYRHDDQSPAWRLVYRSGSGFYRRTVVVSPFNSAVWIAGNTGVAVSVDGGQTWMDRTGGLPNLHGSSSTVEDLAFDPISADTIYALTQVGLYRTRDNGLSWQSILPTRTTAIAFDALDIGTIYAATPTGLFKSSDNGSTWSQNLPGSQLTVVAADHMKRHIIYAGGLTPEGRTAFYRSIDHGETWHQSSAGLDMRNEPSRLVVDPRDSLNLYLATATQGTAPYLMRIRPDAANRYAPDFRSYLVSGEIRAMTMSLTGNTIAALSHTGRTVNAAERQIVALKISQ